MSVFGTIYQDKELPPRARMVYMYLKDRAGKDNQCWPAIRTIARDLKLSRSTVKRALHDLQQTGRIVKTARKRGNGSCTSNSYHIV